MDSEERHELALRLVDERGLVMVEPYDDPAIIAGQGTCGLEIVEDLPNVTSVLVPVSGGGLSAGVATAVRALESAAFNGHVVPSAGWTSLVLGPARPATVVDGLLTGLHEPEASHLDLLRAVADPALVARGYADLTPDYLWHEFGDTMLLLP